MIDLVYIAGPYTAPTPEEIADNVAEACQVGIAVRCLGLVPIVPHILIVQEPGLSWDQAMAECLPVLARCDAVLMLSGWEQSRGAVAEWQHAQEQGLPIFESIEALKSWIEEAA